MDDDDDDFVFTQEVLDNIDKVVGQKNKKPPPRNPLPRTNSLDKNFIAATSSRKTVSTLSRINEKSSKDQIDQLKSELQTKCGEYYIYRDSTEKKIKKFTEKIQSLEKDLENQQNDHKKIVEALKCQLDFKDSDYKSVLRELERLKFTSSCENIDKNLPTSRAPKTSTTSVQENIKQTISQFTTPTKRRKIDLEPIGFQNIKSDFACNTDDLTLPQCTINSSSNASLNSCSETYLDEILKFYQLHSSNNLTNDYLHGISHLKLENHNNESLLSIIKLISPRLISQLICCLEDFLDDSKDESIPSYLDENDSNICLVGDCHLQRFLDGFNSREAIKDEPTLLTDNTLIEENFNDDFDPFAGAPASQAVSIVDFNPKGRDSSGSLRKSNAMKLDSLFNRKDRLLAYRLSIIDVHIDAFEQACLSTIGNLSSAQNSHELIISCLDLFNKIALIFWFSEYTLNNGKESEFMIVFTSFVRIFKKFIKIISILNCQSAISMTNFVSPVVLITFGLLSNSNLDKKLHNKATLSAEYFSTYLDFLIVLREQNMQAFHSGEIFWSGADDEQFDFFLPTLRTLIRDIIPESAFGTVSTLDQTTMNLSFLSRTHNGHSVELLADLKTLSRLCPTLLVSHIVRSLLEILKAKFLPPLHGGAGSSGDESLVTLIAAQQAYSNLLLQYCQYINTLCAEDLLQTLTDPNSMAVAKKWPNDCPCKRVVYETLISGILYPIDILTHHLELIIITGETRKYDPNILGSMTSLLASWTRCMRSLNDLDGEKQFQLMTDNFPSFFQAIMTVSDLITTVKISRPDFDLIPELIIDFLIDFDN